MRRKQLLFWLLLLFLAGMVTGVAGQSAGQSAWQSSTFSNIRLQWNVIVGGGSQSGSTDYLLDGTISESLVGPPAAGSADYQLTMGYSTSGVSFSHVYLPLVVGGGP